MDKASKRAIEEVCKRCCLYSQNCGMIECPSQCVSSGHFIDGYRCAEKDTIERACKWLFSHLPILVDYYDEDIHTGADRSEFIKLFRTQMEE